MPRLPKGKSVKWKIALPMDLAARVELQLMDRKRGIPIYGVRSQLVRELLQDWLASGAEFTLNTEETASDE